MLKKTITYTDYNDVQKVEDFYFNLNKAEIIDLEVSNNGLQERVKQLAEEKNNAEIIEIFRKIVTDSLGKKTHDGRFEKNPEDVKRFLSSQAFVELYVELLTVPGAADAFITAIIPQK